MTNEAQYDDTIAGFYRAAQGQISWSDALEALRDLFGLRFAQLAGIDPADGTLVFNADTGRTPPAVMRSYFMRWHRESPRMALVGRLAEGEWMHCDEHFDEAYVAASRFFQEVVLPSGGRWCSATVLVAEPRQRIVLALMRGTGGAPLDGAERRLAERLARHLRDAVQLWRVELSRREAPPVQTIVLDALRAPLMLIDFQRHVLMANAGARALLARGEGLRLADGTLLACAAEEDRRLLHALRALQLGEHDGQGGATKDRVFLRIERSVGRSPLAVCLYALRPHGADGRGTPLAVVLLHDPDLNAVPDPWFLAASYNFTPAEAKVALALARGIKPKAIAHEHGVALSTVRSQLKSAMAKAGVRSQADLMNRLVALPVGSVEPA